LRFERSDIFRLRADDTIHRTLLTHMDGQRTGIYVADAHQIVSLEVLL
jgi:hypothetical protein